MTEESTYGANAEPTGSGNPPEATGGGESGGQAPLQQRSAEIDYAALAKAMGEVLDEKLSPQFEGLNRIMANLSVTGQKPGEPQKARAVTAESGGDLPELAEDGSNALAVLNALVTKAKREHVGGERLKALESALSYLIDQQIVNDAAARNPNEGVYQEPPQLIGYVLAQLKAPGGIQKGETPDRAFLRHLNNVRKELGVKREATQQPPTSLQPSQVPGGGGGGKGAEAEEDLDGFDAAKYIQLHSRRTLQQK